jgi:maleate isomerase
MMRFEYTCSEPIGARGCFGLLVLQADETIEQDVRRMLPEGRVALYVSRVPSAPEVTPETLARMGPELTGAARLLPPSLSYDAVGYGCTSGASVIGANNVAASVKLGCAAAEVTNPMTALVAACRALEVHKLAFLTPYMASVSEGLRVALAAEGVQCVALGGFDEAEEAKVARIDKASIVAAATAVVQSAETRPEALFLSCTNLRTLDVIDVLESALDIPVLSSNQVLAWHMFRLAGIRGAVPGRLGRV